MNKAPALLALALSSLLLGAQALGAEALKGEVRGAGAPIADSSVTLWAAGTGAPKELGYTRTDAAGRFAFGACMPTEGTPASIW